ncbi:sucrose nonfermenting 4-like protein isoform X8 [Phragmites australis]|uniref:sucrose nonfermenting 4-like protein isoform X8 n=1 Tax=Phragmites australis TaxID=29695 RepID=UPI002D78BA50|nr:sucrose nonfermenting 4-like protein isoform X8 [Phragmites australis]
MVLQRFSWPYGGRRASFCGSFTGWTECPMGLVGAEFQVVFDLPPGVYQYRFLVDGIWRCDETKPCVRDEYGVISNEVLVENNAHPVVQPEPSSVRGINMDEGTILTTMPPEPSSQNSGVQIAVFRHGISGILLHNTIYDVVPVSSKLAVLDTQLPVKQAFKIMHDEVKDSDNLVDVALTIIRNEISSVPIFKSLPDSSGMPLLNLATLSGILKFLCSKLQEQPEGYSLLQNQLVSIPIGTWSLHTGRESIRQLRTLRLSTPLNSCLDFLLQDRISSIPIVDDNGSLHDVYSLSDIMALAKNDVYARIELEQVTVQNALDVQYQVNGRRQCHTCSQTSTLLEILEELSIPGVRRLVVIEPSTRFVEGIVSLRDIFTYLLG